jgi:hypothetical protein
MLDSSIGSSSEVNLPVSFTSMKTTECTIKEHNKIVENLDLEETSAHTDKGSSRISAKAQQRTSPPEMAMSPTTTRARGDQKRGTSATYTRYALS